MPKFWASGKWREEGRVPWWEKYDLGEPFCVFGHYWRMELDDQPDDGEHLFDHERPYAALGVGQAICIDYSVGKRYSERLAGVAPGRYRTRLAALRWPERMLVFDEGDSVPMG